MGKNIIKNVLIIYVLCMIIFQPAVYADSAMETMGGILTHGFGYFLQDDTHMDIDISIDPDYAKYTSKTTGKMVGMLQVIGSVIAVAAIIIIGIRYMLASVEEKSKMHQTLIYYLIGAVLVFATTTVVTLLYKVIGGIGL